MAVVEQVKASDWATWVEARSGVMIDVREPDEWALGVLPGAELIRLADLPAHVEDMDQDVDYLIVCRSGNRSQQAAIFLQGLGFRAANLAGGMVDLGLAR